MWSMMVPMFWAAWKECAPRLRGRTWADYADVLTHLALAIVEIYMLGALIPLWIALPGLMFAALGGCLRRNYLRPKQTPEWHRS